MKLKTLLVLTGVGSGFLSGVALAGTPVQEPAPMPMVEEEAPSVSGSLSLDYNSHFISYGADVWGAGSDVYDSLFNPAVELVWPIADVSLSLGAWFDINNNAVSDIGGKVQEVDFWTGLSWDVGSVSMSLTYQVWLYAGDTEQIVDFGLGFDLPLDPSITIHGRVDEGASGGDTGIVAVLGVAVASGFGGIELGDLSVSLPVNVAGATDGFHGGDSGFAYVSAGLGLSYPIYGGWDIHGAATYYYTDDSVIPNNADDSFVTLSAGVGFSF